MSTTSSAFCSFTPFFAFGNTEIAIITNRYIRVRQVVGSGNAATTIAQSLPLPIAFSPSAPRFTGASAEVLETTPSCIITPTGSIRVRLTKVTDTILYIVKPSSDPNFCNPITNNPPCFNVLRSGKTTETDFFITGIPSGSYNVFISNLGGAQGTCLSVNPANVGTFSPIQIESTSFLHPSCFQANDGKIELNVSGGDSLTYRFVISPNIGTKQFGNGKVVFSNLPQGNYNVSFTDTCGLVLNRSFQLKHPPKVEGNVIKTIPTCASPGNGAIQINANYNFAEPGYNTYSYKLYKNGVCIDSLLNTSATSYIKNGLNGGNYRTVAFSPLTPNCVGIDETFVLPFNPLAISVDSVKHIDCSGQQNGYIKLKAIGGTNSFVFNLRNIATGITLVDTLGVFNNLANGNYVGIVRNKIGSCLDSSKVAISINQPQPITITVNKQDITCYNANNGTINAIPAGGNGMYTMYWEKLNTINNTWLSFSQIGNNISNLAAGFYRAKAVDQKNCVGLSSPIQIIEPDTLLITSVIITDIPCFAGTGSIVINASGGTAPYTSQLIKLPNTSYVDYNASTTITAGKYLVRIKDSRNCITYHKDTITITSPPSNLDFTYSLSSFNGYNISCFDAANGVATFSATGGNGDIYTQYYYTYDNQPWQTTNTISNIPAGNRVLKVKDDRGCIKTKAVLFTQPNDSLLVQLVNKTNIICFGASTGIISVKVNGGVRPYKYSLNGSATFQSDSTFASLPAGNYTITVKDANNCTGYYSTIITHLNTLINIASVTSNTVCNSDANGSIQVTPSGGVPPYTYTWSSNSATTTSITNLLAGTYTVNVKDNVNCIVNKSIVVSQPLAVTANVKPFPVCFGNTTGKIIITPSGGTAPFQYSKDNGLTYQTDSTFSNLPAGNYNIKIKDVRNCTWTGTATVGVISNSPNLNFIISSNQHASDTVTMKEISWIKPDSIKWEFHPSAVVIDPNRNEPKIKFLTPDTGQGYWVRLIGYYPTCTYVTQKAIKIYPYDPNAVVTPATFNKGIKKAELFPNPNNGQFTLNVEFYKIQKATVYITSTTGVVVGVKQFFNPSLQILKNYVNEMNGTGPGTYFIRIVSDYDSKYILFVKQ